MFRRTNIKPPIDWELAVNHPDIMLDDVLPLPESQGDISSLPLAYQAPVDFSFVKSIQKAAYEQQHGTLAWFNARLAPSVRLNSFMEFTIFDIMYQSFLSEIEFLNSLHERILSPTATAMADLWASLMCLHRLLELLPRVFASGWRQDEIENMLLVVLDHGNNADVRLLGFYTLSLYMLTLGDDYSETTIDMFTNVMSLRAFSYIDMPAASCVVGKIMCAIASGADVAEIGCGQRAIIGFPPGRASICPVLQDTAQTINPQGMLAFRMMRDIISLVSYLASLVSSPVDAYTEYISLGFIGTQSNPFDFINQRQGCTATLPPFVPMLALSSDEILKSMQSIHRLFRRGYLSWIYPNSEGKYQMLDIDPFRGKYTRQIPILGLRFLTNAALERLVPQHSSMMVEDKFCMPYIGKSPQESSSSLNRHPQDDRDSTSFGVSPLHTRAYDTLRRTSLDQDVKSAGFLMGVMRLSLLAPQFLDDQKSDEDTLDKSVLAQASYEACLCALTVIRLWIASKEEYRPFNLLALENGSDEPTSIVSGYLDSIYNLLDWLVSDTSWDDKKLVLLYNTLLVHKVAMRLYQRHISYSKRRAFMDRLQKAEIVFLSSDPQHPTDITQDDSLPNRALIMLTECLVSGWLFLGGPVTKVASQFKSLYSTRTPWTIHLSVWCNVLRALTIARGRHILKVDERVLVQESMFSGQRQRKGLSKADMYMHSLQSPTHHLEPDSSSNSLETATPFNITSKLTWDSMRMVFAKQQQFAQEEQEVKTACIQSVIGSDDGLVSAARSSQLTRRLKAANSVYVLAAVSGSRNLHQLSDSVPSNLLKEACLQGRTPPRVLRSHSFLQQRPELNAANTSISTSIGAASSSKATSKCRNLLRLKARPASDSGESSTSTGVWKKFTLPFRRKTSLRLQNEEPGRLDTLNGAQLVISPANTSLANPAMGDPSSQIKSSQQRASNKSPMLEAQAAQQQDTPPKDEDAVELSRSPDSMVSMQLHFQSSRPSAIGPAALKSNSARRSIVSKHIHQQLKSSARGADMGVQKSQVARLNSAGVKGEVILRGLVDSWDVYRAVLDCSRYTPDNDDVLLNTSWWVAEMATSSSVSEDRGRMAQTAIFRLGCQCLDHAGLPINVDQIQVFLVECSLLLSLGISGARMLIYSLDTGLRRLLLESSSYDGDFPEPAICGAITMLVSIATILCSGRVLNANHANPKIRPLTDSNMTSTAEFRSGLGSIVDSLDKTAYPIIADPLATREYSIAWKEGGPIFGRSCETMYCILLDQNSLKHRIRRCGKTIEHAILSGLAVVCLTELSISNKGLQNSLIVDNCMTALISRLFSAQHDTIRMAIRVRVLAMELMRAIVEQFERSAQEFNSSNGKYLYQLQVIRDMASLLLTVMIKVPELITNADTLPAEIGALSFRDFLVEKIIHLCAHPASAEALRGHQYNRALSGADTGRGVVLSLTSTTYVDDHVDSAPDDPSPVSPDQGTRDEAIEAIKMDLFRNLIQHKLVYSARKTTVNYYVPLVKSESLFRDIRALDRIHARETIKVAVLYVGPGQWSEAEILSNSSLDTSRSYRSFVSSLGWRINLATFQGFTGKLESNGSDGESCPYYADESTEVAFHEAAAMPKDLKDMRQMKKVG
ncbi:hypothetical protein LPJ60_003553 [Coemansia sp. RSA 2675]|nr:hypothetical protein LPJ60_003553 [Coemansia sp. RSA 2675]